MIEPSDVVRALIATRSVDFRKGMNGLIRDAMGADLFSGAWPVPIRWPRFEVRAMSDRIESIGVLRAAQM